MKRSIRDVTMSSGTKHEHGIVESADVEFETRSLPN